MFLPPHREKGAKVEGRDPPEVAKATMETFKSLTRRLLKVVPEEVMQQQRLYEETRLQRSAAPQPMKLKGKRISLLVTQNGPDTADGYVEKTKK